MYAKTVDITAQTGCLIAAYVFAHIFSYHHSVLSYCWKTKGIINK